MISIKEINTTTVEGRMLMAALSQLSGCKGYEDLAPDDILEKIFDIEQIIYKAWYDIGK